VTEETGLKVLDPERCARVEQTLREAIGRELYSPAPVEAETALLKPPAAL